MPDEQSFSVPTAEIARQIGMPRDELWRLICRLNLEECGVMNQGPSDARFTDRQAQIVVLNIKILRELESDRLILDVQEQLAVRVANGFAFDPGSVAAYARDVRWYLKELTRVAADMSTDGPLLYYEEPALMIEAFRELLRDAAFESKPEAADSPSLRRRIVLPPEALGAC